MDKDGLSRVYFFENQYFLRKKNRVRFRINYNKNGVKKTGRVGVLITHSVINVTYLQLQSTLAF